MSGTTTQKKNNSKISNNKTVKKQSKSKKTNNKKSSLSKYDEKLIIVSIASLVQMILAFVFVIMITENRKLLSKFDLFYNLDIAWFAMASILLFFSMVSLLVHLSKGFKIEITTTFEKLIDKNEKFKILQFMYDVVLFLVLLVGANISSFIWFLYSRYE